MLWRVKDTSLYLLGSVYAFDQSPPPITKDTEQAYAVARRVVFETNFEKEPDVSYGYYPTGETLSGAISAPLYETLKALWHELGKDEAELERLRPWLVGVKLFPRLIERSGFLHVNGIAKYFFSRAKADERIVRFFETSTSLMQTFAKTPPLEQERMLAWALQREAFESDARTMVHAWHERRAETFRGILNDRMRLSRSTFSALIRDRNQNWIPAILGYARDGVPTLAIVEVLHMFGPSGLPALLRELDYVVTPVDHTG
jgi:uncharacterized protein YbaP (TraB family)